MELQTNRLKANQTSERTLKVHSKCQCLVFLHMNNVRGWQGYRFYAIHHLNYLALERQDVCLQSWLRIFPLTSSALFRLDSFYFRSQRASVVMCFLFFLTINESHLNFIIDFILRLGFELFWWGSNCVRINDLENKARNKSEDWAATRNLDHCILLEKKIE